VILVDTNVISDIVSDDPDWSGWSLSQLEAASLVGKLVIVDVVYAELAALYGRIEDLDEMLDGMGLDIVSMGRPSLFLAARAFAMYRERGGSRTGVLPDFFIGAHASVEQIPLLTRDARRYRTYFPRATLIAPEPAP
jgi:predicted nucleic acid-binding protein